MKGKKPMLHFTPEDWEIIMRNIDISEGMYNEQAKALVAILYYTAARPNEVLRLKRAEFYRDRNDLVILLPASKRGNPRPIKIPLKKPLARYIWDYINKCSPSQNSLIFYHYLGDSDKPYKNQRTGNITIRKDTTYKLYYYWKKWVKGISIPDVPPYYLRHERCSLMAERGASLVQIMEYKGCKTEASVAPYLHMSTRQLDEMKKML